MTSTTRARASHILEIDNPSPDLPFHHWASNVHSQSGEDGIVARLLDMAGISAGYFVEFGAWDGRHLSNCAVLADAGWAGCFIEGDKMRHRDLVERYSAREDVATLNAFVRTAGEDRLDAILDRAGAPREIGVMSIDIDGCDYYVWESVREHMPSICIVEFNPTIPANVIYAQENDSSIHRGCSLAALCRLSRDKGYSLVAATELNGIFMPTALCERRQIPTYRADEVKSRTYEAAIFHGYDGMVLVAGHREMLWHGVPFAADALQVLPTEFRRFAAASPDEFAERLRAYREALQRDDSATNPT